MPDAPPDAAASPSGSSAPMPAPQLEQGTYEIICARLKTHTAELNARLHQLNQARQTVFGAVPTALLATERITTAHSCTPRDMISIGQSRFLFGYNVYLGLKSQTELSDVFAAYAYRDRGFQQIPLDILADSSFTSDFKTVYKYYRQTALSKLSLHGPHLFMAFQVGRAPTDLKAFKWLVQDGGLAYQGSRSDQDFKFPPQHEFEWIRTHRDLHRSGAHPHISIDNRLFVEAIEGDLTIKIEDNTNTGKGIYSEPVVHKDQTLDDAEVFYALLGNLILVKIRPYQEESFRHFLFNDKLKEVHRIDALADACVLLPNDHGVIFSNGYYLQHGELKQFPTMLSPMLFERRVAAPNGEDFLYVFYNMESGTYVLMSYNMIEQRVDTPIVCSGFSLFENGELALFRSEPEPQKHHAIQIWQTPYLDQNLPPPVQHESYLYKLGNVTIVRAMAECRELLALLGKHGAYASIYVDLVKRANAILDSYFWLDRPDVFDLKSALTAIRDAAVAAIDEFEKVIRLKRAAQAELERVREKAAPLLSAINFNQWRDLGQFVTHLAGLRELRGELISAKEIRYVDRSALSALEETVAVRAEEASRACVGFLLKPEALASYQQRIREHGAEVEGLTKAAEAKRRDEAIAQTGRDLELLISTVSNLKIEDATQSTLIIDRISATYAPLNQLKAALKRRRQQLQKAEGEAQFNAQMRLLDQSVANYLEVSDTPDRCQEYLTKLMVHVEELEGRFAEFDEFILKLADKRDELVSAFESRQVSLVEARNKQVAGLLAAAERTLKSIQHRAENIESLDEINGFFAADLMVDRVRTIIGQLTALQDSVKADDLATRLKTIQEEALRQNRDRKELFVDGRNIIQLGQHKFSVNTQALDLSVVYRDGAPFFHLAGTNFFEAIQDPDFLATRSVWDQEFVSETPALYRGEYLAYQLFQAAAPGALSSFSLTQLAALPEPELLPVVQQFMAPRYSEGYIQGLHDRDAARILHALAGIHASAGLLRYSPQSRACALAFWRARMRSDPILTAKLAGFSVKNRLFPGQERQADHIRELQEQIRDFNGAIGIFPPDLSESAGEYLFFQLTEDPSVKFVASPAAAQLIGQFDTCLRSQGDWKKFEGAWRSVEPDPRATLQVLRDWIEGYLSKTGGPSAAGTLDEAASLFFEAGPEYSAGAHMARWRIIAEPTRVVLAGMAGSHPSIENQSYALDYHSFLEKLRRHEQQTASQFVRYQTIKSALIEQARRRFRLDEFRPKVLTSFVRNRLIDSVYLPLVGDNLAKQIGAAGAGKRTDRMGLLLLISPPGYGKTTLMEYVAHRLGIVFVKINGPALGYQVTSLDPAEARNAAAREEISKVNLALEMGDNVMLYLDDIQHCHPELLQKFISLCDAQRKIEGVYNGRARTYDLRGKKVAVVMAGNPYTESGEKFKVPDMLANRADTFNLGDIAASQREAFETSFLENALTSNPVLHPLTHRSQKDFYTLLEIARSGSRDGASFEASYSAEEINEMVRVIQKLCHIRDTLLRVNREYIRSAAQADAFRTEPAFKLQGSYRNMNRLAEKVLPVLNDDELQEIIQDHYRNEAQTLTTGAEANLLKFKELQGVLSPAERQRWEDIKRTFKRNLLLRSADETDPVGRVIAPLATITEALEGIRSAVARGLPSAAADDAAPDWFQALRCHLADFSQSLEGIRASLSSEKSRTDAPSGQALAPLTSFAASLDSIKVLLAEGLQASKSAGTLRLPSEAGTSEILNQLSGFVAELKSIRGLLEQTLPRHLASFRLIDPSRPADYEITSVTQDTLQKIWALVEDERRAKPPEPPGKPGP